MRYDRERLDDIVGAADKIAERVRRGKRRFDADEDTRLAIVHLIEIIGEATSRMRNRVVHGYFDIDFDIVWEAATVEVPPFAA
jgi:uncharacterized protein with HEPN domain